VVLNSWYSAVLKEMTSDVDCPLLYCDFHAVSKTMTSRLCLSLSVCLSVCFIYISHQGSALLTIIVVITNAINASWTVSIQLHAHTVVWECCRDDRQSQWEVAKFDPQPTLNPWTDRHQIWNTWLRRGYPLPKNLGSIRPGDFVPHIPEIYTQNLSMFTSLF